MIEPGMYQPFYNLIPHSKKLVTNQKKLNLPDEKVALTYYCIILFITHE